MADLPRLNIGAGVSGDVQTGGTGAPADAGQGALAQTAEAFSQQIGVIADREMRARAADDASNDVVAGTANRKDTGSLYGETYNTVMAQQMGVQRVAAMQTDMGAAAANNPNNPAALAQSLSDIKAGYKSTGIPTLDAELDGHFATLSAQYLTHAQEGLHQVTVQTNTANFMGDLQNQGLLLHQVAVGAGFDATGGQQMAAAQGQALAALVKYGPPTEFKVGNVVIPADPKRNGLVSPEQIEQGFTAAVSSSKVDQIEAAADKLPDATSKQAFLDDIKAKFAAGDPAFAGLKGDAFDTITSKLETDVSKAQTDERQTEAQAEQQTHQLIEGLQWGADVTPDQLRAAAAKTKNPGLQAEAEFYASVPKEMRGVLKTVVARSLGLGSTPGPGVQILDDQGNPVDTPAPGGGHNLGTVEGILKGVAPGLQINSDLRDPAHNASVRGVSTSWHMSGQAVDFYPGQGVPFTQAGLDTYTTALKAQGVQIREAILERKGDPHSTGDHFHIAFVGAAPVTPAQAWAPPPNVQPGTPAFVAWANTKEGFASDPINFARGGANRGPIATVPPIIPDNAFSPDPVARQNWASALQARQATGAALARSYAVPPRMLTNGEKDAYAAELKADPGKGIVLAQAASQALGPNGAMALMREIGQGADNSAVAIHIGDLVARGGSLPFAQTATQGLNLMASGAKMQDYDKKKNEQNFDDVQQQLAPAFRFTPDAMVVGRQVAEAARTADAAAGQQHAASYYMQSALGAHQQGDTVFGGVAPIAGAPTVLPSWLAQDKAPQALASLGSLWVQRGNGPKYSNGAPVGTADLGGMQWVMAPSGRYRLLSPQTKSFAGDGHGHVFEVDLDKAKRWIQLNAPGSVAPGP